MTLLTAHKILIGSAIILFFLEQIIRSVLAPALLGI